MIRPAPRLHFLQVGGHLLQQLVAERHGERRKMLIDQGNGPVLHLTRGVAFGVDEGDLLELQGAFQSRKFWPRPRKEAARIGVFLAQGLGLVADAGNSACK